MMVVENRAIAFGNTFFARSVDGARLFWNSPLAG
jgi:hypothetical protein